MTCYDYETVLRDTFGFAAFRKGQLEAIETLFAEGQVLCIQPTGYGKSLLYQLPTCLLEGITLVVSPLLALMRDQIGQLHRRFHIPAASINSDQSQEENAAARTAAIDKKIRILFISPEQLDHIDRFEFLTQLPISLFVVDEAHCISTWGHDFRPSYRQILTCLNALRESNPALKILALTATADARVERDLQLQLSTPKKTIHVIREAMDRPNLFLSTIRASSVAEKLLLCQTLLSDMEGNGLIYTATRDHAELLASFLQQQGVSAVAYHAGLDPEEKRRIQQALIEDKYKVVAATTALGMGIDKSNLRFIIHFDIPGSITSYYQEVGRAGRDGLKAHGILLFHSPDIKIQEHFIDSALPSLENFEQVFEAIRTEPLNVTGIKRMTGLHPTRVSIILAELIEQNSVKKKSVQGSQVYLPCVNALSVDLSRYTNQHCVKTHELEKMRVYAEEKRGCRMATLRTALGDAQAPTCGRCDLCTGNDNTVSFCSKRLATIELWIQERPVPIAPSKTHRIDSGVSILDGTFHSQLFIRFMKERMHSEEIEEALLALLKKHASLLASEHPIAAIIPLPSRTWKARESVAHALAEHLSIPAFNQLLTWKTIPESRQGALLNNDQRQHNVQEHMQAEHLTTLPAGSLLLLDDYIGSGASLKEAARALRASGIPSTVPLVPLTVASIKWHLGKPGFI
jgi:ATP-dependent DNA helicase RecQ